MRTQEKIGVAIVGLGIGEKHAHAYHKMDNCVIHWFYDLSYIKAKVVADELGQGRVAASFEEVLHDPKVQIISIASYDSAHFEQVVAALDAGKHVFVEKPICRTIDELEIVKRAWIRHKNKLILSSNLVLRSAPLYQWLKNKIESKVFGEIYPGIRKPLRTRHLIAIDEYAIAPSFGCKPGKALEAIPKFLAFID